MNPATRAHLASAGVPLGDADWEALPEAARRRLSDHPIATQRDRRTLRELARWLLATFPPGWNAAAE